MINLCQLMASQCMTEQRQLWSHDDGQDTQGPQLYLAVNLLVSLITRCRHDIIDIIHTRYADVGVDVTAGRAGGDDTRTSSRFLPQRVGGGVLSKCINLRCACHCTKPKTFYCEVFVPLRVSNELHIHDASCTR